MAGDGYIDPFPDIVLSALLRLLDIFSSKEVA